MAELRFSPDDQPFPGRAPVQGNALDKAILARPALIVEDEAMIAWTLESLLEDMGFKQIAIAASGADAIQHAKQKTPGLILSDINLGANEMDGVAAVAAIVAVAGAAVVFITANASADAKQRIARDVPGAAVLRKPVSATELWRAIVEIGKRGNAH